MRGLADEGDNYNQINFRDQGDDVFLAPPLYSGIKEVYVDSGSRRQSSVILRQQQPLPLNIMSLSFRYNLDSA